jgi:hypothetical protein
VPRRKRDEVSPPAPLDPYVTTLVRWIAAQEKGISSNSVVRQIVEALGWPPPFAEAVLSAAKGRRLLTQMQTSASGGVRSMLSVRGRAWLEQTAILEPSVADETVNGSDRAVEEQ